MNKLDKIEREAQKAKEKIAAMQSLLKQIEGQRTEQENLQIIQQVRALKLSRDELYAFLGGGALPPSLVEAAGAGAPEQENIYSRSGGKREQAADTAAPDNGTPEDDNDINDIESEDTDDED